MTASCCNHGVGLSVRKGVISIIVDCQYVLPLVQDEDGDENVTLHLDKTGQNTFGATQTQVLQDDFGTLAVD